MAKTQRKFKNNKPVVVYFRTIALILIGTLYLIYILIREAIRNTGRFIVGLLFIIKWILISLNKFNVKMFKKAPYVLKLAFIYGLIATNLFTAFNNFGLTKEVEAKEYELENAEIPVVIEFKKNEEDVQVIEEYNNEQLEKKSKVCENEIACRIYEKSVSNGLTHEQSLIVVSISRHETGNWTSKAFNNKNNFGGIMCSSGLKIYESFDDGLDGFVNLLTNRYFGRGLNTIEEIGNIYCPVGASNDPNGVNQYWIPNVTKYYNEYLN